MQEGMVKRASELLADGTVVRVLGWKNGEFAYDPTPAVFESAEALSNFVQAIFLSIWLLSPRKTAKHWYS